MLMKNTFSEREIWRKEHNTIDISYLTPNCQLCVVNDLLPYDHRLL
jgi:hypothetical protein